MSMENTDTRYQILNLLYMYINAANDNFFIAKL